MKDPVVYHLPYFQVDSKFSSEITIDQLLIHTSGLPSVSSPDVYEYLNPDLSENALENHIKSLANLKLEFKPGKKYGYSNLGYEVLGDVIAKASGMAFEEFMKTRIFQPLKMNKTSYFVSDFDENEIAQPHQGHPSHRTANFPYDLRFTPSGNLFTSIQDISHWVIFGLNRGRYKRYSPLSDENYTLFCDPGIDTKEDGFKSFGWFVKETAAGKIYFHDGLDLGFSSLVVLMVEHQIGIAVLVNHQEADCNEILNLVAKTIRY